MKEGSNRLRTTRRVGGSSFSVAVEEAGRGSLDGVNVPVAGFVGRLHGKWSFTLLRFEAPVTGVPERFRDGCGNMKSVFAFCKSVW